MSENTPSCELGDLPEAVLAGVEGFPDMISCAPCDEDSLMGWLDNLADPTISEDIMKDEILSIPGCAAEEKRQTCSSYINQPLAKQGIDPNHIFQNIGSGNCEPVVGESSSEQFPRENVFGSPNVRITPSCNPVLPRQESKPLMVSVSPAFVSRVTQYQPIAPAPKPVNNSPQAASNSSNLAASLQQQTSLIQIASNGSKDDNLTQILQKHRQLSQEIERELLSRSNSSQTRIVQNPIPQLAPVGIVRPTQIPNIHNRQQPSPFSNFRRVETLATRSGSDTDEGVVVARSPPGLANSKPRSTHNVIEKRYRLSINDKIIHLKDVVLGPDVKMNKSGILQRAIDYIKNLEHSNMKLRTENNNLRLQLNQIKEKHGYQVDVTLPNRPSEAAKRNHSSVSEGFSESFSPLSATNSNYSSSSSEPGSPPAQKSTKTTMNIGMTDRSKVTLFMMAFCVLFFNPVGIALNMSGAFPTHGEEVVSYNRVIRDGSRALAQFNNVSVDPNSSIVPGEGDQVKTFLTWFLNSIIILVVMTKVLMHGDSNIENHGVEYYDFWRLYNQSKSDISKHEYAVAAANLKKSVCVIGCPVAVSTIDMVCSIAWRFIRLLMQRGAPGRWLLRRSAAFCYSDKNMNTAQGVALAYHKLYQLYLSGCVEESRLCGILYGLTAVTFCDYAFPVMSKDKLAEIYFTAAIGCETVFPWPISCLFCRYISYYARRHTVGVSLPSKVDWLCSTSGYKFLLSNAWSSASFPSLFTSCPAECRHDPLECVAQHYRQHLLQQALMATVIPKSEFTGDGSAGENWRARVQEKTMIVCGFKFHNDFRDDSSRKSLGPMKINCDDVSFWWASVINTIQAYIGHQDSTPDHPPLTALMDRIPDELQDISNKLPTAVQKCLKARIALSEMSTSRNTPRRPTSTSLGDVVRLCDESSALLREAHQLRNFSDIELLAQVLCADVILMTRRDVWNALGVQLKAGPDLLASELASGLMLTFKKDLQLLHRITNVYHPAKEKSYMYDAVSHLMSGHRRSNSRPQSPDRPLYSPASDYTEWGELRSL